MAKQVVLLFPGQGSQYAGMGKDLTEQASFFDRADKSLGLELKQLCFEGPADQLKLTEFTQPAIVTHSIALFNKVRSWLDEKEIKISKVMGHSVGEYSALCAAGVLKFEDAVKAVHYRGKFMQEAVPAGVGSMYAVVRVPSDIVEKACQTVTTDEESVSAANFNEPGQTVISGHKAACEKAVKWIEENFEGRARFLELPVSAPFHSPLMKPAEIQLEKVLAKIEFNSLQTPYIANWDAKEYSTETAPNTVRASLLTQVCASVRWTQSFQQLPNDTIALEIGPGKVLTGLAKKINPTIQVRPIDKLEDLNELEGLFQ